MLERITLFVWFGGIWPGISRKLTMQGCGGVCAIVRVGEDLCDSLVIDATSLPLSMGGLGLRSAVRTSNSAFWAGRADSMVRERHPLVADMIVDALDSGPTTPILSAVVEAARVVQVGNFERLPPREPDEFELLCSRRGWQHEAASRTEMMHRDTRIMPRLTDNERAMLRSQSGPGSGLALSSVPSCAALRIDSHHFRVLLLRQLRLSILQVSRTCRCGRLLDPFGHHRAACSRAGVLGRRGFALESVGARICRGAGARVWTNVFVRDLNILAPNVHDARRLEIVAEGLPLHGGAQLAVDTTLVSAHHCDGTARPGAAHLDGAALVTARRRKERAYPELVGPRNRAKLVVLAGEVGGRRSEETATFLRLLAAARARRESALLRRRVEQAWRMRWSGMLACAAARAFAASLLEQRSNVGRDDNPPLISDVLSEFRHAGLG